MNDQKIPQSESRCICEGKQGIFLDKRQLSRIAALVLIASVFVFVAGYFWGQRTAVDQLLNVVERDSFADQVYYSMCSLYDQKDEEGSDAEASGAEEELETEEQPAAVEPVAEAAAPVSKKYYHAQLAGFSTKKPAEQLVTRLSRKGIKAVVHERQSKTARGNVRAWYQVVTPEFSDLAQLQAVIGDVKKYEKIHDVRMVEREKGEQ